MMGFQTFMLKVRYLDNLAARWIMRHVYLLFFEVFLVFVFLIFFANTLHVINLGVDTPKDNLIGRLLLTQSVNTLIIALLLILNSFWTLYIFNNLTRLRSLMKEMNYHMSKFFRKEKNLPKTPAS